MTELELFIKLEELEEAERAVRAQRKALEDECAAYGHSQRYLGRFRLDNLRVNYNIYKALMEQVTC